MTQDTPQTQQEPRRAKRRPTDQPSTVRGTGSGPLDSWVHDLSISGMRIECRADLAIGEEMTVGLAGAGATKARVVWRKGNEYGCAFLEPLSEKDAARAFSASPVVSLVATRAIVSATMVEAITDAEEHLLRRLQSRPASGRFWFGGLAIAMIAVAIPAVLLIAHLTV